MSVVGRNSEQIAGVFYDWLSAEVITSGESRNRYLDAIGKSPEEAEEKFADIKNRLALPYEDDNNWAAQKDRSHQQQRVPAWVDSFEISSEGHPKAEYYAAQVNFAPLMTTSGSYRVQCYLMANSPTEYVDRRSRAISIDIEESVDEALKERNAIKSFSAAEITFDGLRKAFDHTYGQTEAYFRGMSERLRKGFDESSDQLLSVKAMEKSQANHIKLATDCVIMAAKLRRGELEAVPFLEPVSITDQSGSIYYPLAQRIDWAKALAA